MNRNRVHLIVYWMPMLLIGLLLTCGTGPPDADDETSPATPLASAAAVTFINQALTRTFTLPTPLFAPGSAWNQTATGAEILAESDQQILVTYRVLLGDTTDPADVVRPAGPQDTGAAAAAYANGLVLVRRRSLTFAEGL